MKKLFLLILCFLRPIFAEVSLDGISSFGWNLFQTLQKTDENTIFSPYSIYSCLSMTAAGAQGNTLSEMQKALHLPLKLSDLASALSANNASLHEHMKIANSLWIAPQFPINPEFRKTIEGNFKASVTSLDFSLETAADTINQWIAKNTDQKITQLLAQNDVDRSTRLVLANAIYFSGKFLKPFDPKRTTDQKFWIGSSSQVKAPMMEQTSVVFYAEDSAFQTVAIPMEASQIAFMIFLPKEKIFTNLSSLLSSDKFMETLAHLDLQNIRIKLPKFALKKRMNLNQPLSELGLVTAFTRQANFSGMAGKLDLFLSKVLHEAYFALDESGIVATAATVSTISTTAVARPPKEFTADHPFIFALVDLQTKIPLFIGELITPP